MRRRQLVVLTGVLVQPLDVGRADRGVEHPLAAEPIDQPLRGTKNSRRRVRANPTDEDAGVKLQRLAKRRVDRLCKAELTATADFFRSLHLRRQHVRTAPVMLRIDCL